MTSQGTSEKEKIGRATSTIAFFTFISKLLGLVRNQILSHFFGATLVADAFIAAYTIPNTLRRLLGEGALTPAIVSIFSRSIKEAEKKGTQEWRFFISNSFFWLSLILIIATLLGIFFAPWLVQLYVPDFSTIPEKMELTVQLTRFLFPFILLMSWFAFFMGILNTFGHFVLPAAGPMFLNLTVIILVPFFTWTHISSGIYLFAAATLAGGILQTVVQLPSLKKRKALPSLHIRWPDSRVKELGALLIPSTLSLGIYQLNIMINRIFASGIEGAVSHLYYADLLLELPIAVIATSVGTAVIPSFSRLIHENNRKDLGETFHFVFTGLMLLSIPSAVGLIVLAKPIISTIYFTGKFTFLDLNITSASLVCYSLGLPIFSLLRIIIPLYFAEKNAKIPAYAALVALLVNLIAAWSLSKWFQAPGIALATVLASLVQWFILMGLMFKKYFDFPWKKMGVSFLKITLASLVMGLCMSGIHSWMDAHVWDASGLSFKKIGLLTMWVITGVLIYSFLCFLLKVRYFDQMIYKFRKRIIHR